MIIDSFAGGGGASTGIEMALGRSPDVAINHSEAALALHAANHPDTIHLDSNIWDVDPKTVCGDRHVGLLWASPDCKHFSKAKGGAPRDRNVRDLAWVVIRWAEIAKPDVIIMENVEEFQTWGPIDNDGKPLEWASGQTYELWLNKLRKAGYKVQSRELRACDYGAPTIRKRWFLIARRDGRPIVWPKPTHGDPTSQAVLRKRRLPWRAAAECIDWSLPCPSIFDTTEQIKERHNIRGKRPLAQNTMARIARGLKRYVLDAETPFIVNAGREAFSPSLTRFNGGATGSDMRHPAPTVTANSYIQRPGGADPLWIATAFMATMRNSQKPWQGMDQPTHTITAGGAGISLISPVLTYAQHGGANRSVLDPHHTICANSKDQNSVIVPTLVQTGYGERAGQKPRSLDIGQPLGTVVAGGIKHALATAFIARHFGQSVGHAINEPSATITAGGGGKSALASAFLAQHNTGATGHDARDPMSTIAATGSHQNPVTAFFAKYYGTGDGARMTDPMHTITVRDRFAHTQASMGAPPFSPEHEDRAREVAEFLRSFGAWTGGEFVTVTIKGTQYVIIDIGLRMLSPRELFKAQGFPDDYVIEGVWTETDGDWTWNPFPKHTQVSCCGNSVPPVMAEALAGANCKHLSEIPTTEGQTA